MKHLCRLPGSLLDDTRRTGLLVLLLIVIGCGARDHRLAQEQGESIRDEVVAKVSRFRSEELIDPFTQSEEAATEEAPTISEQITLESALKLGTRLNRGYLSQRESLFQSALSLGVVRRDFLRPVFSGSVTYNVSGSSDQDELSRVTGLSLNGSQYLFTGGRLSVSAGSDQVDDGVVPEKDYSGNFSASISQPLLRGAGKDIPYDALTDAERNLLYTARNFESFRQSFAIQITQEFYNLLSQKIQLSNAEENVRGQQFAYDQAKALFRIGTGSSLDVFRAEQALLVAKNSQSNAIEQFQNALDTFKLDLGISIDSEIELVGEFPDLSEFSISLDAALTAAMNNRLDLLTARDQLVDVEGDLEIARNGLLPDLNLNLSYGTSSAIADSFSGLDWGDSESYSAGLNLEIPLDRLGRRNAFRNAEIALDREIRALELKEQQVRLEVQSALRQLEQLKFQLEIGSRTIESLSLTVEKAEIDQTRGTVTNRDVVEAQTALTDAKNAQLDRIVAHEIQILEIYRLLGLLFVSEEGMIIS
jgi:outer membrane protein TolC